MKLYDLTIHETSALLNKGEISAKDITQAVLDRIEDIEDSVDAYITINADKALKEAELIDNKIAKGEALPTLAGMPMAVKDNICTKNVRTTCSSKMLEDFVPPYDATLINRLKKQGTICLGKLNMDEFAMGSSTENSAFKDTKNPWDLERVPGGSSGGSAAAVASGEAMFSLGSDTGGSIRQPASFSGLVGLKPTYGRVSRYGLIALAPSLDTLGPITKDVRDAAIVLNAIAGSDSRDFTSSDIPVEDYTKALKEDIKGVKIGVPNGLLDDANSDVRDAIEEAINLYESIGAQIQEIDLPHIDHALTVYRIISAAEASSNLARYDGIRYGFRADDYDDLEELYKKTRTKGFGPEVKRRIMLGNLVIGADRYEEYYLRALKARTLIREDFNRAFKNVDVILTPTSPGTAFKLGEVSQSREMSLSDKYTVPSNLAGLPAISIPCGFDKDSLPIGMQLIGDLFDENIVMQTAYAFEQRTDYHRRRPNL